MILKTLLMAIYSVLSSGFLGLITMFIVRRYPESWFEFAGITCFGVLIAVFNSLRNAGSGIGVQDSSSNISSGC